MEAIRPCERRGDIPDELLLHIAPLGWRHINLLRRYEFQGPRYSLAQCRQLRTEAAGELHALLDDEPENRVRSMVTIQDADSRTKRSGITEISLIEQGGNA